MKRILLFFLLFVALLPTTDIHAQLFWRTDGTPGTLTASTWGTSALGPFTNAWVNSSNINFTANSSITNVTNIPVGNITVTNASSIGWTAAGTFSTGGGIRTVDTDAGSLLVWNGQAVSTAAGTGFIKSGTGTWNIGAQANAYPAGFTLNNGTIIFNNNNALGSGTFTINAGTIQSTGDRNMSVSSIVFNGNATFSGTGNATWPVPVSLGLATRVITNSTTSGSRRFTGIISGNGLTFTGSGAAQFYVENASNSFSGPLSILGSEVIFNDDPSLGTTNSITIDGGRFSVASMSAAGATSALPSATISSSRTIYVGDQPGTSISIIGSAGVTFMDAIITDKPLTTGSWAKQGAGRLTIGSVCTYTGSTSINNGSIRLRFGNNRLPVSTSVNLGQAGSANLGTLDLNGYNQEIAGLNSITGTNASANKNTITSASDAVLTVSGSGNFGSNTTQNSGIIAGSVSLVKSGAGTLTLADANTYSGTTTVSGGTLQLNRTGGSTIPNTSNVTINGGVLRVSSNQELNNLIVSSGTLLVDAGVVLTINGSYSGGGTITNNGTIVFNAVNNFPGATTTVTPGFNNLLVNAALNLDNNLRIDGTLTLNAGFAIGAFTLTLNGPAIAGTSTFLSSNTTSSLVMGGSSPSVFIPSSILNLLNLTVNHTLTVNLNAILTVGGNLQLNSGILSITAGNSLTLQGASLTTVAGFITGTSSSDLTIAGTTGGDVVLPTNANILLRNVSITGNRVLRMNGIHNISLSGLLSISATATFDNGGESQITNNGGSISITGTFITRDVQGFTGANAAIPGLTPVLNTGCTIEYGLNGNQAVQGSTVSYQNVRFSGSGIKTLASVTIPSGTVFITGSAVVQTNGNNFGGVPTALTMDGGRLILTTTGTQPAMEDTYTLTGGVVEFNGASAQTIRNRTYQNIEVTGAGVGNSSGNITLRNSGTFTVTPTGIFTINDNSIIGITPATQTQVITVQNGGIFRSGNNEGFHGFTATLLNNSSIHSNITNINLLAGSTVEYSRNGDQPITTVGGLEYVNLILSGTSGQKIAPSGTLVVKGNLTKTGACAFVHNSGTVQISGAVIQQYQSTTPVMVFNNLSLLNTIGFSVNDDLSVFKELSFAANSKLNIVSGNITLLSGLNQTANIGQIPSSASISYQPGVGFIAERFIATGTGPGLHPKSWQLLSVPVNNGQTIKASWQEGAAIANANPVPGYGVQITSSLPSAIALGFDVYTPAGGPSMKTYNPAGAGSWDGVANTSSLPLYNSKGYMIFVRGDRSVINFSGANSAAIPTILRAKGRIFQPGSNPPPITTVLPGKFESVGNPYASAISLSSVHALATGDIQNIFYVWDPLLTTGPGSAYGLGGYRTLTFNGTDYDVTPPGGSYGSTVQHIQSGQAFFVKSFSAGGTVSFNENCKVNSSALVTRPPQRLTDNHPGLGINLYASTQSGLVLIDGVLCKFSADAENGLDMFDAVKLKQNGENISILEQQVQLSVSCRQPVQSSDTIFLHLQQLRSATYTIQMIPAGFARLGYEAFFEDLYLQTSQQLFLEDTVNISFDVIGGQPESQSPGRFRIVFVKKQILLPVYFSQVSASRLHDDVQVSWSVETGGQRIHSFDIEKSSDAVSFAKLAEVVNSNHSTQSLSNVFIDEHCVNKKLYYRIKANSENNTPIYSRIVHANERTVNPGFYVFPNPVIADVCQLYVTGMPEGKYSISVINLAGQKMHSQAVLLQNAATIKAIDVSGLLPGNYFLQLIDEHGKIYTTSLNRK